MNLNKIMAVVCSMHDASYRAFSRNLYHYIKDDDDDDDDVGSAIKVGTFTNQVSLATLSLLLHSVAKCARGTVTLAKYLVSSVMVLHYYNQM